MKQQRHTVDQIIGKLLRADIELGKPPLVLAGQPGVSLHQFPYRFVARQKT